MIATIEQVGLTWQDASGEHHRQYGGLQSDVEAAYGLYNTLMTDPATAWAKLEVNGQEAAQFNRDAQ